MVTGCLKRIEKTNICINLTKICFQLIMKIWDSVYLSLFQLPGDHFCSTDRLSFPSDLILTVTCSQVKTSECFCTYDFLFLQSQAEWQSQSSLLVISSQLDISFYLLIIIRRASNNAYLLTCAVICPLAFLIQCEPLLMFSSFWDVWQLTCPFHSIVEVVSCTNKTLFKQLSGTKIFDNT